MAAEKPRRLGRGLEALLGAGGGLESSDEGALKVIPISQIGPNPYQPRQEFRADQLAELRVSIEANGLLQPITVRRRSQKGGFELIAGERRLRAATELGWKEIPAIIKDIDDKAILTLALVENLQRSDLNPIEEAEGYQQLVHDFGLTQQEVAERVGKDRTTVANMLRVLQLPEVVRKMLRNGEITLGHAKPLLSLEDEGRIIALAKEIVANGLTVREVERRLREEVGTRTGKRPGRPMKTDLRQPEVKRIEDRLRRHFQTDVTVVVGADDHGSISIRFYSPDDLERIMELMRTPE